MIGKLIRWIKGGRYELWYVDHPVCADIWHRTTTPNVPPNIICRGQPIKVETHRGLFFFKKDHSCQENATEHDNLGHIWYKCNICGKEYDG